MALILPLALAAGAPALAAEDQFDLACQGHKWTQRGGSGEDFAFRARIDLKAGKWCEGDCKATSAIASVSDDKLMLADEGTLNTRIEMERMVTYDRKANSFHYRYSQFRPTDEYLEYQGSCTAQPFTPFPQAGG